MKETQTWSALTKQRLWAQLWHDYKSFLFTLIHLILIATLPLPNPPLNRRRLTKPYHPNWEALAPKSRKPLTMDLHGRNHMLPSPTNGLFIMMIKIKQKIVRFLFIVGPNIVIIKNKEGLDVPCSAWSQGLNGEFLLN